MFICRRDGEGKRVIVLDGLQTVDSDASVRRRTWGGGVGLEYEICPTSLFEHGGGKWELRWDFSSLRDGIVGVGMFVKVVS